jgi:transcriptional regulator with XRE-family HTH domain
MRAYRTHPDHGRVIPQEVAAAWVGITQARLSRVENGYPVTDLAKLTRWASVLTIPPDLLWFAMPSASSQFINPPLRASEPVEVPGEPTAGLPAPKAEDSEGRDDMNRRQLLRLVSMASTALALDPTGDDIRLIDAPVERVNGTVLDEYAALNRHLWQVFALSPAKADVLPLVRRQFHTLTTALHQLAGPATHGKVCTLVADVLQLAGEILFDANAYTDAAHCYTLAASAAHQSGAHDLWACALTRHAFIALYDGQSTDVVPMLGLAGRVAERGDHELSTRQWVAAVHAQALAAEGDLNGCQLALDVAHTVDDLSAPVHADGWLRFDGSRLAEERGARYTELGRPDLAQNILTEALGHTGSARRRGSIHVDLAIVGAQQHDLDRLLTHGSAAVQLARQTKSG